MISRTKIRKALSDAIEAADPNKGDLQHIIRERITYPMKNFRHKLWLIADEFKIIDSIAFDFSEENIGNQLTVAVFKTATRRIRLSYNYKTDIVDCFVIGKDCDGINKTIPIDNLVEEMRLFIPARKIVRIKKCQPQK